MSIGTWVRTEKEWMELFKGSFPENLFLERIILHGDSAVISLTASLSGMVMPERWRLKGYDSVSFDIVVGGVSSLSMKGFYVFGKAEVSVELPLIRIVTNGGDVSFLAAACFLNNIAGFIGDGTV
ncbi:hypothetical protein [Pseudomonas citronellolis]|uniref:hypothetical protein n=1 Tax=Pseudomonas citronellolis TaxID=53408 RepID=UPI0011C163D9|nr:hypothetical protein [Pseudomonas citronellolis]